MNALTLHTTAVSTERYASKGCLDTDSSPKIDFSVLNEIARITEVVDPDSLGLCSDFLYGIDPQSAENEDHCPLEVFISHDYDGFRSYLDRLAYEIVKRDSPAERYNSHGNDLGLDTEVPHALKLADVIDLRTRLDELRLKCLSNLKRTVGIFISPSEFPDSWKN